MIPTPDRLFWKRSGWSPVVAAGILLAVQLNALALQDGLSEGIDRGFQAFETGQVELQGPPGGIDRSFTLRALAEQKQGVTATSARLDFSAELEGPGGLVSEVRVRACSFAQEEKVTGLADRVTPRGSFLTNGFVLSRVLAQDPQWKDLAVVGLSSPAGAFDPVRLNVAGSVRRSAGPIQDDVCYLDLDTALRLFGPSAPVSSVVLRLDPGINARGWVEANRDAFQGYGVSVNSWEEGVNRAFPHRKEFLNPLRAFLSGVAVMASLGLLLIAGQSRPPRSGLSLLLRAGRGNWGPALGVLVLTAVLTSLVVFVAAPSYQSWILGELKDLYPFVGGPGLLWRWTWREGLAGGLVFVLALTVFAWPRAKRRSGGTHTASCSPPPERGSKNRSPF